jgi:hypothetical protein
MRIFASSLAALTLLAGGVFTAHAAPVYLQDYEAPGNLDAPFNLQPHFSGSTQGVQNDAGEGPVSTIIHVNNDGAPGTSGSAELFIPYDLNDDAGGPPTAGGWAWQVRFLPNSGASPSVTNPVFTTDGYLGYWLKVEAGAGAVMFTGPALDDPGTTQATVGDLKAVIADGQWHLYQWNMDDASQFDTPWKDVFDDASTLGDGTLAASASFDAIAIVSTTPVTATVRIDQIGYDNAGRLVPEPTTLALVVIGLVGIVAGNRRIR